MGFRVVYLHITNVKGRAIQSWYEVLETFDNLRDQPSVVFVSALCRGVTQPRHKARFAHHLMLNMRRSMHSNTVRM